MRSSVSEKYPQVYRLSTKELKIQSRRHEGTFVGLVPQTKFQPPNWNVKH